MSHYGFFITRVGLSSVLFWFGIWQITNPSVWVGFIPPDLAAALPFSSEQFVLINGSVELVLGTFLLLGMYTRVVAAFSAFHLATIALSLGLTPTGIRDWGLAAGFLSLAFTGPGKFSVDYVLQKKKAI